MDKGRELADKELLRLERSLSKEYATAKKEMKAKYNKFMQRVADKDKEKRALLTAGAITKSDYDEWRANQTYRAKWFKDMIQTLAKDQTAVNKRAAAIINGATSGVYAEQFNYGTYMVEKAAKVDTAFTLYDKGAVRNLNAKAEIKITKDIAWNNRKINSALMQGILQGESIPDIANRLARIPDMNAGAAVRNARTLMTSAENEGRLDSFERAADMGIKLKKTWIATLDDSVRASHAELDGETVELDEPFSNGLMYPADPSGDDPAEIYNCRCTMIVQIAGFERDITDSGLRPAQIGSYDEWKAAHARIAKANISDQRANVIKALPFAPAQSIQEAEQFAKDKFIEGGFNLTGKSMTYSGVDLEVANRINQRLNDIYGNFNVKKLTSLESFGKRNKKVYSAHKDAPMMATNFGNIGINSTLMKSTKTVSAYNKEGQDAFELVMSNIDKLSGAQKKLAESYKFAGRSLVGNDVEDYITHEVGHFISYMPDVNKKLSAVSKTEWTEYAKHLSGYANHSFGEYIAESFNAYYKGERNKLQPEIIEIFDSLRR